MSASYDDELPADLDKVRSQLAITDVRSDVTALVSDEHIEAVLTWKGSVDGAVAFLAGELAARFAQKPSDVSLPSGMRVSWRQRIDTWLTLAGTAAAASAGGGVSFVDAVYSSAVATDEFSRPLEYQP